MHRKYLIYPGLTGSTILLFCLFPLSHALGQESNATRDRRASITPAAEATLTINEQFLNSFLTAIFDNLHEPSMPLTIGGASSSGTPGCASEIKLKREVEGVRTAVHFEQGRITGPVGFAGAYGSTLMAGRDCATILERCEEWLDVCVRFVPIEEGQARIRRAALQRLMGIDAEPVDAEAIIAADEAQGDSHRELTSSRPAARCNCALPTYVRKQLRQDSRCTSFTNSFAARHGFDEAREVLDSVRGQE